MDRRNFLGAVSLLAIPGSLWMPLCRRRFKSPSLLDFGPEIAALYREGIISGCRLTFEPATSGLPGDHERFQICAEARMVGRGKVSGWACYHRSKWRNCEKLTAELLRQFARMIRRAHRDKLFCRLPKCTLLSSCFTPREGS